MTLLTFIAKVRKPCPPPNPLPSTRALSKTDKTGGNYYDKDKGMDWKHVDYENYEKNDPGKAKGFDKLPREFAFDMKDWDKQEAELHTGHLQGFQDAEEALYEQADRGSTAFDDLSLGYSNSPVGLQGAEDYSKLPTGYSNKKHKRVGGKKRVY